MRFTASRPLGGLLTVACVLALSLAGPAHAATPVGLGTAASFAVLAGSAATNTGPSTINGNLGVSPGTSLTGFGSPATVNGSQHSADGVAAQAQQDLETAYDNAAQPADTTVTSDLGGQTLTPGVYQGATLSLTGTVTLDAVNDPDAVFIFLSDSDLIVASGANVSFTRGASACNVFWRVVSSATLGSDSTFSGSILALTSITANNGATVAGRLLARNGAVTLDDNVVGAPGCSGSSTGGSTGSTTSGTTTGSTTGSSTTGGSTGATTGSSTGSTTTGTTTGSSTTGGSTGTTAGTTSGDGSTGGDGAGGTDSGSGAEGDDLPSTGAPVLKLGLLSLLVVAGGLLFVFYGLPVHKGRHEA